MHQCPCHCEQIVDNAGHVINMEVCRTAAHLCGITFVLVDSLRKRSVLTGKSLGRSLPLHRDEIRKSCGDITCWGHGRFMTNDTEMKLQCHTYLHSFLPVCFNHLVECRRSLGLGYVYISLRSPIEHWEARSIFGTDCGCNIRLDDSAACEGEMCGF